MVAPAGQRPDGRVRPGSKVNHATSQELREVDVSAAAGDLLRGLVAQPWGQVTPSVYETGRVASLLPGLAGQAARVRYLLTSQRRDSAWGGPDGYALVPTLSAVEALLAVLARADPAEWEPYGHHDVLDAAERGLRAASKLLDDRSTDALPDTPAIEILVPALVDMLNDRLADRRDPVVLPLPHGVDPALVRRVREALRAGGSVPDKLLHSLEVFDTTGAVHPVPPGTVGASPAATARWLSGRPSATAGDSTWHYLETVAAVHGGAVPSVVPITMFERAWVLSGLRGAAITADVPQTLVDSLADGLTEVGLPGGAGLPADADTTSVVLLALRQRGRSVDLDCLWEYRADGHFQTWPGERTPSVTTNAHVLEAFGHRIRYGGPAPAGYPETLAAVVEWIAGQQHDDGYWTDKWHASPWYATVCCVLALHRYGGERGVPAVRRAVEWVLSTQDGDGAWGRWGGTAEETAYAVQILLVAGGRANPAAGRAASAGYRFLRGNVDEPGPPLWHDKDLFQPVAVVRAAVLAALRLAQRTGSPSPSTAPRVV
jgi:halimadienyl-diphosphate synthase